MTRLEVWGIILKAVAKHLIRRWYIYASFLTIFTAPLPVVLVLWLGWMGYFLYRLLTPTNEKDTL